MRHAALAVLLLSLACAKKEEAKPVDTTPAMAPAPPPPAAFPLSSAAGTWTYVVKSPTGDTTLVNAELTTTADTTGWILHLPNRKPIALKVSVSGDSVMTSTGPYQSVLQKGVMVTTESVMRMVDGNLVGATTAHYNLKTADSVRHMISTATRKP